MTEITETDIARAIFEKVYPHLECEKAQACNWPCWRDCFAAAKAVIELMEGKASA